MINDQVREATLKALLSGALSGGALGAGGRLLGGARKLKDLAKGAAIGGGISGALAGGSTYLGSEIMGPPKEADSHAFTHRGGVGGAVGGGTLGAALGAGAAGGLIGLPSKNVVTDYFTKLARKPNLRGVLAGAGAGALGLGALAGYMGSDEGMQVDFINQEMRRAKRRQLLQESMDRLEGTA